MLIQVIGNGPGVADQERIFDAFVTTKINGMGIGLAVSRSIVEAHGAAVTDISSSTSVSGVVKVRRDCAQTKSYRYVLRSQL